MRIAKLAAAVGVLALSSLTLMVADADAGRPKLSIYAPTRLSVGISRDRIMKLGAKTKHRRGKILADFKTGVSCDYRTNGKRSAWMTFPGSMGKASDKPLGHNVPGSVANWSDVPLATLDELRSACVAGQKYVDVPVKFSWECLKSGYAKRYEKHQRKIRIHLECDKVLPPGQMRARVTPYRYEHSCPAGFAFSSGKARVVSSEKRAPGDCFKR